MRRIDIVTSSAPLALSESSRTCWFGYCAVPTNSRDLRAVPAMISGSDISHFLFGKFGSAALQRPHDLDPVIGGQRRLGPFGAAHDRPIDRDGEETRGRVDAAR